MAAFVDLTGQRFGRLTVIERGPNQGSYRRSDRTSMASGTAYWCLCDCGKRKLVRSRLLRAGNTKSCGCLGGKTPGVKDNPIEELVSEIEFLGWDHSTSQIDNIRQLAPRLNMKVPSLERAVLRAKKSGAWPFAA